MVLERETAVQLGGEPGQPLEHAVAGVDLCIVLGGDGTMLATARAIGARPTPILGINLGQLGFLTELHPEQLDPALAEILGGEFQVQERSRLAVTHLHGNGETAVGLVLNDAVVTQSRDVARIIELESRVDGRRLARYRADGLIVSTPTGSTAYNLSAGGPLIDAGVAAMILTPICPHMLSMRPQVLPDMTPVEVRLTSPDPAQLTLDGQVGIDLAPGDGIRVIRSESSARFVVSSGHDPFETLRNKLGWAR